MLRITGEIGYRVFTFRLEGRLTEPWIQELEACWQRSMANPRKVTRYVDLTGVTFVDAAGKSCLAAMQRQGAEFIAADCMTKAIVAEISQGPFPDAIEAACDADRRLESFAEELTGAVYSLVLRRRLNDSWIKVELGLWSVLAETVKKWARQKPPLVSSDEINAWRERFLLDLTDSALCLVVENGIQGSLFKLGLGTYAAVRRVIRRHRHVS